MKEKKIKTFKLIVPILIIGFVVMSLDSAPYGFGFVGLTLGPIIVMLGFMIQFFAILHNPGKDK